jgi:hypothetical protein
MIRITTSFDKDSINWRFNSGRYKSVESLYKTTMWTMWFKWFGIYFELEHGKMVSIVDSGYWSTVRREDE